MPKKTNVICTTAPRDKAEALRAAAVQENPHDDNRLLSTRVIRSADDLKKYAKAYVDTGDWDATDTQRDFVRAAFEANGRPCEDVDSGMGDPPATTQAVPQAPAQQTVVVQQAPAKPAAKGKGK